MAEIFHTEYQRFRRYYQTLTPIWQKPKTQISTAAIFTFLAISLFGWYAIRPTVQTIIFLQREIADNVAINSKMEEKITNLIEAQAAYQTIQNQVTLLNQAVPPDAEVIELTSQLRNLSNLSGASISAIQVASVPLYDSESTTSAKPKQALKEYPVNVIVTGTYDKLETYLNGLLSMRRITIVDTLGIEPEKDSTVADQTLALELILKLRTFYNGF